MEKGQERQARKVIDLRTQFDEKELMKIGGASGSSQPNKDVKLFRRLYYLKAHNHEKKCLICEYIPDTCFWFGYLTKNKLKVYGMCVAQEYQGKGYCYFMRDRIIKRAKAGDVNRLEFITQNKQLYENLFHATPKKNNKSLVMEAYI